MAIYCNFLAMNDQELIDKTTEFVKETLSGAEGGHDWFHIERVLNNAQLIAKGEKADRLVVALGALLHDIADAKFHNGDESIGPRIASEFLMAQNVASSVIAQVIEIIEHISFKNSFSEDSKRPARSIEFAIVQDADRLDALGAIGIARAFNYGGYKNRELYNPAIAPNDRLTKETYKTAKSPTINHFYEKLLLLKDQMNTNTAKKIAAKRHRYMEKYLEQFYDEWSGKK